MTNANTKKTFSLNQINWTASAVNRYYFCQAKIRRAEKLFQSYPTISKWYREYFKAEDRMRAMGI